MENSRAADLIYVDDANDWDMSALNFPLHLELFCRFFTDFFFKYLY